MKKLLILLFSLLISFNSYGGLFDKTVCVQTDSQLRDGVIYLPNKTKPFSGKNLCKYQNGQNKSKGKIKDGKKNELWTEWEENGQIKLERTYEKGKLETETKYKNGELERTTKYSYYNDVLNKMDDFIQSGEHYKDGNLIGKTKYLWYRHNGQLREEWNFKDGELYGRQRSWFANGQIEYEGASHYNGKLIGKSTTWHKNGKKKSETNFKEGGMDGESFYWFENGQLKEHRNYKNNELEGKLTVWNENGQIEQEWHYKNDELDGTSILRYANGQKRQEGNFKKGKEDGKFNWWNEEGELIQMQFLKNGKCVSGDC